jgi:hypothetical protein
MSFLPRLIQHNTWLAKNGVNSGGLVVADELVPSLQISIC